MFRFDPRQSATPPRELPRSGSLSVVGLRVDTLELGAVLELDRHKLGAWRHSAVTELPEGGLGPERAGQRGVVRVWLEGWQGVESVDVAVTPVRGDRWAFKNADLHGIVDEHPLHKMHLTVHFHAAFLATNTLDSAVAYMRAIAATLGTLLELRTKRLDLAADIAGWQIREGDRLGWVKPGRSPLSTFTELPDSDEPAKLQQHGGAVITGFSIGAGGPIMLRNYDKRAHLDQKAPEKREGEEAIWRVNGWDGETCVARVEFQLRGAALRSFGIDAPDGLAGKLDAVWQALVLEWCRLVVPGTATRKSRAHTDARWELLERCRFSHFSYPALRARFRGGSTMAQALGVWMSYVASHEGATDVEFSPCVPEGASEEWAYERLARTLTRWALAGARTALTELSNRHGSAREALRWVSERAAVSLARVATVGGGAEPPPAEDAPARRGRRARPHVDLRAAA